LKTRILILASSLALLLLSSLALADGRPTGIRITRLVSGGNMNVELDISVTGTNRSYNSFNTSYEQWIGNTVWSIFSDDGWQYASSTGSVALPYAIDWGDGDVVRRTPLFGGGPWGGTFSHTYTTPGTYTVTVGDAYNGYTPIGNSKGIVPFTGNAVTGSTRYVWDDGTLLTWTSSYSGLLLAITATDTISTGTGIPVLNIYGLLAMGLVLVGTGVLVFRRPQRSIT